LGLQGYRRCGRGHVASIGVVADHQPPIVGMGGEIDDVHRHRLRQVEALLGHIGRHVEVALE
jgi:hypothetical protein